MLLSFPLPPHPSIVCRAALSAPDYSTWKTEELYRFGSKLLRYGDRYTEAITVLEIAVKREPKNPLCQNTLGCAYACRFASLSTGLTALRGYPSSRKIYDRRHAEWEKAREDAPTDTPFTKAEPDLPDLPVTPDDNKPLTATPEAIMQQLAQLRAQSVAAFEQANQLSKTSPAETQAETAHLRGWGLFLLLRYTSKETPAAKSPITPSSKEETSTRPLPESIAQAFQQCVESAPDNALYWQSLGIGYTPELLGAYPGEHETGIFSPAYPTSKELDQSLEALEKSLTLKPRDVRDTRFLVALVKAFQEAPDAGDALAEAARPFSNATLWWLTADVYLQAVSKQADTKTPPTTIAAYEQKAIQAIRSGNQCAVVQDAALTSPVPALLLPAWRYRDLSEFSGTSGIVNATIVLESSMGKLSDLLKDKLAHDNDDAALSLAAVLQQMSEKVISAAQIKFPGRIIDATKDRIELATAVYIETYDKIKAAQLRHPTERKNQYVLQNVALRQQMRALFQAMR